MKNRKCIIAIIMITALLSACSKDLVRGEGPIQSVLRTDDIVGNFNTIRINGEADIYISYGTTKKLELQAYQNLLPLFETKVQGEKLILEYKDGHRVRNNNIKIYLTLPFLPNIEANGSCRVKVTNDFPFQDELYAEINGSGDINYPQAGVKNTRFSINGSGYINAINLISVESTVNISGSGDVKVTVSEKLNVNISGSGKVYYKGRPLLKQQISGSGKIISL